MEFDSKKRRLALFLMATTVVLWGIEYIIAKGALDYFNPINLLFCKYTIGTVFVLFVKMKQEPGWHFRKKDIILFVLCCIFGELLYYGCEYTAMDYVPLPLITIILALVPILAMFTEWILYKKRPNAAMLIGAVICILGIAFIIGVDLDSLFRGQIWGYLLCFGSAMSWNIYNFLTDSLTEEYGSITLTFNQLVCTILLTFPYAVATIDWGVFTQSSCWIDLLYLGIISSGVCYLIYVYGVQILGPTIPCMFSNFLPVATAFFSWLLLGETLSGLQIIGGVIVIAAGYVVIKEKEKMEDRYNGREN